MNEVKCYIKYLTETAKEPKRKSIGAAAYDLYSDETVTINPGEARAVSTGIGLEILHGWKGEIYPRSSMALKGVTVPNAPGKIDSDYRGEIKVLLHNQSSAGITIAKFDRIAQFEIAPVYDIDFMTTTYLSQTPRGEGGFGSTGK